jgi:general secretion pathway protein G
MAAGSDGGTARGGGTGTLAERPGPPSLRLQYTALSPTNVQRTKLVPRTVQALEVGVHMRRIIIEPMQSMNASRMRARIRARAAQAGFTLIELMVVLVIIGVLAALIVPNVLDRADDARATAARTDVNNLMQALKLYRLDNQRYPTTEQGLQALVAKPSAGPVPPNWKPYLEKLPNDPWGRPYQYLNPGVKGEIDVMSLGADGQPGGDGKNADVGSWQ